MLPLLSLLTGLWTQSSLVLLPLYYSNIQKWGDKRSGVPPFRRQWFQTLLSRKALRWEFCWLELKTRLLDLWAVRAVLGLNSSWVQKGATLTHSWWSFKICFILRASLNLLIQINALSMTIWFIYLSIIKLKYHIRLFWLHAHVKQQVKSVRPVWQMQ